MTVERVAPDAVVRGVDIARGAVWPEHTDGGYWVPWEGGERFVQVAADAQNDDGRYTLAEIERAFQAYWREEQARREATRREYAARLAAMMPAFVNSRRQPPPNWAGMGTPFGFG